MKCVYNNKHSLALYSILLVITITNTYSATWAIALTCTEDYYDGAYRHQADTYRFVQQLYHSGLQRSHIILINPDTVRNSTENPYYPYLFSEPECDARDVTFGITVNFTNTDINVTSVKNMLGFRKPASGESFDLEINSNDTLIYYIVGHGTTGVLACKNDYLFYDDIIDALDKFLLYHYYLHIYIIVDACMSGSLFNHTSFSEYVYLRKHNLTLSHDINVISGADDSHNTYATNCYYSQVQTLPSRGVCLSDEFSKHVMDSIKSSSETTTMADLFTYAKQHTLSSPVTSYGKWEELAWSRTVRDVFGIGEFVDLYNTADTIYHNCLGNRRLRSEDTSSEKHRKRHEILDAYVKSHPDILKDYSDELSRLKHFEIRSKALTGTEKKKFTALYNKEKKMIDSIKSWEKSIREKYSSVTFEDVVVEDWTCFRRLVKDFDNHLGHSTYGMNRFYYLATLCKMNSTIELEW